MKIKFGSLYPHRFAWDWNADQRILLVGLWFVVMGVDFGLATSPWMKHFNAICQNPDCGLQLNANSRLQIVRFHKDCRTDGRAFLRKQEKMKLKTAHA